MSVPSTPIPHTNNHQQIIALRAVDTRKSPQHSNSNSLFKGAFKAQTIFKNIIFNIKYH